MKLFKTWKTLNAEILEMSEKQVKEHLEFEKLKGGRASFMLRLHARYNVLRAQRERTEIYTSLGKPDGEN